MVLMIDPPGSGGVSLSRHRCVEHTLLHPNPNNRGLAPARALRGIKIQRTPCAMRLGRMRINKSSRWRLHDLALDSQRGCYKKAILMHFIALFEEN